MIPITVNPNRDWFEFLLDLNLLDRHLTQTDQPEPSACSLITHFLYHANMTEQLYTSNATAATNSTATPLTAAGCSPASKTDDQTLPASPSPSASASTAAAANQQQQQQPVVVQASSPNELKSKRIRVLRILAIKAASICHWDLLKFERDLPIAVISDLLHIYLRLTMNENSDTKSLHSQLDLSSLEPQNVFALQLLHRWCLRVVIFSRPGVLNPLQHMKDANDNILKLLSSNVQESVDFLEKCVQQPLGRDLLRSTSVCFGNISAETGNHDLNWEGSVRLGQDFVKRFISYDLGMYYFQAEDYEKAFGYFKMINEFGMDADASSAQTELRLYTAELDSYMLACKLMLNKSQTMAAAAAEVAPSSSSTRIDERTRQIINKILLVDNKSLSCAPSESFDLYEFLLEDNTTNCTQLSVSSRLQLESSIQKNESSSNRELIDQISSANLVRLVSDSHNFLAASPPRNYQQLSALGHLGHALGHSLSSATLSLTVRFNLVSFVKLNIRNFSAASQRQLIEQSYSSKLSAEFSQALSPAQSERATTAAAAAAVAARMHSDDSPAFSPPSASTFVRTKDSSNLTFAKLTLQTCDPIILKSCINKYNHSVASNNQANSCIRFFWPKWQESAAKLATIFNSGLSGGGGGSGHINSSPNDLIKTNIAAPAYLSSSLKLSSLNDMDFFYICFAKINQLISINKFELASKLFKSYENSLSSTARSSRLVQNQSLYLAVMRFLAYMDAKGTSDSSVQSPKKSKEQASGFNTKFLNQEQIVKSCKQFLQTCKNEPDTSIEVFRAVLAFLLSVGEFGLLLSNDCNLFPFSQQQQQQHHHHHHHHHHKKHQSSPQFINNPIYILFNLTRNLAKLYLDVSKSADRGLQKRSARDLWDILVDLYTDSIVTFHRPSRTNTPPMSSSSSKPPPLLQLPGGATDSASTIPPSPASSLSSSAQPSVNMTSPTNAQLAARDLHLLQINRQQVSQFLIHFKNRALRNLLISLLTSIYNVFDNNNEIKTDLKYLWPTSSSTPAAQFNLQAFQDLVSMFLANAVDEHGPYSAGWSRVMADMQLSKSLSSDAVKFYLKYILLETRHFFRNRQLMEANPSHRFDEKILKFLIKSFVLLNKHTQAALMCQMLHNNNEYTGAFRYLQDSSAIVPTCDEMDLLYECTWDVTLLEYLLHLNTIRGYVSKKNLLAKLISMQNVNSSNPAEIYQKTVEVKKTLLFLKLVDYYFL